MIDAVILVNVCSVLVFLAGLAKNWMLAKGNLKPVYILNIIMGLAGCLLNIGVVMAVPAMAGILSFMLLNIWVALMGVKGLYRLRQERLGITTFEYELPEDSTFQVAGSGTYFKNRADEQYEADEAAAYRVWQFPGALLEVGGKKNKCRWAFGPDGVVAYACFCATAPCPHFQEA